MTNQEPDHDMQRSANPLRAEPEFSQTTAPEQREDLREERSAGVVSHRDQFSEPASQDGSENVSAADFSARLNSLSQSLAARSASPRPVHCSPPARPSKPKYQTLFLLSGCSIKANLYGGIVLQGMTVFGKNVEVRLREIKSIEAILEFSDTLLEQVSLKEAAVKLFVTCENSPYDLRIYSFWKPYLQEIAIPMIENMIEHWIGASSPGISNPVTEYFFGRDGILRHQLDRESIVKRIKATTSDPVIPLMTRYKGPAMVLVYEE